MWKLDYGSQLILLMKHSLIFGLLISGCLAIVPARCAQADEFNLRVPPGWTNASQTAEIQRGILRFNGPNQTGASMIIKIVPGTKQYTASQIKGQAETFLPHTIKKTYTTMPKKMAGSIIYTLEYQKRNIKGSAFVFPHPSGVYTIVSFLQMPNKNFSHLGHKTLIETVTSSNFKNAASALVKGYACEKSARIPPSLFISLRPKVDILTFLPDGSVLNDNPGVNLKQATGRDLARWNSSAYGLYCALGNTVMVDWAMNNNNSIYYVGKSSLKRKDGRKYILAVPIANKAALIGAFTTSSSGSMNLARGSTNYASESVIIFDGKGNVAMKGQTGAYSNWGSSTRAGAPRDSVAGTSSFDKKGTYSINGYNIMIQWENEPSLLMNAMYLAGESKNLLLFNKRVFTRIR